tara:strand:- start:2181 stop:2432 length:252 start_codon:yes stop_codon:yes gene_type:complete
MKNITNEQIDKLIKEELEELPKDPETLKRMRKAYLDFYKEESAKYKEKKPKPYTRKKIMGRTQIELATGGKVYSNIQSRKVRT